MKELGLYSTNTTLVATPPPDVNGPNKDVERSGLDEVQGSSTARRKLFFDEVSDRDVRDTGKERDVHVYDYNVENVIDTVTQALNENYQGDEQFNLKKTINGEDVAGYDFEDIVTLSPLMPYNVTTGEQTHMNMLHENEFATDKAVVERKASDSNLIVKESVSTKESLPIDEDPPTKEPLPIDEDPPAKDSLPIDEIPPAKELVFSRKQTHKRSNCEGSLKPLDTHETGSETDSGKEYFRKILSRVEKNHRSLSENPPNIVEPIRSTSRPLESRNKFDADGRPSCISSHSNSRKSSK
uniref:Uncharacterized protein n=1 Tax=Panagrolaimus superbus TaxID=310955 RepID=A0A914YRG1_9BILA